MCLELRRLKREIEGKVVKTMLKQLVLKVYNYNKKTSCYFLLSSTPLSICLAEIAASWYKPEIQVTHPLK